MLLYFTEERKGTPPPINRSTELRVNLINVFRHYRSTVLCKYEPLRCYFWISNTIPDCHNAVVPYSGTTVLRYYHTALLLLFRTQRIA